MDYEIVTEMAQFTAQHNGYHRTVEKALEILYLGKSGILSVLQDMTWMEKGLLDTSEEIIGLLQ